MGLASQQQVVLTLDFPWLDTERSRGAADQASQVEEEWVVLMMMKRNEYRLLKLSSVSYHRRKSSSW